MGQHRARIDAANIKSFPPLPLDAAHWAAIFEKLGISARQGRIVELILCDYSNEQIARAMGIGMPTIKTYLQRIFIRTQTRGRMQLAMRVLEASHEVAGADHPHG